jgi:hypothetical protein
MSDGRQCLSGSEYRKRKAEKDAKIKKQTGAINKFCQQSTSELLVRFKKHILKHHYQLIISMKILLN